LWGLWWQPLDTLRQLIASEAFRWDGFVADLAGVVGIAAMAVALVVARGCYDRWRRPPSGADDDAGGRIEPGLFWPMRQRTGTAGGRPVPAVSLAPAGCAVSPTAPTLGIFGGARVWDRADTTRGPPLRGAIATACGFSGWEAP
jgi:hypothetical protein